MDLIRFSGRFNYGDLRSSPLVVVDGLQAVGGVGISIVRPLVAAGERPAVI